MEKLGQTADQLIKYCNKIKIKYSFEQLYDTIERFEKLTAVSSRCRAQLLFDHLLLTAYNDQRNDFWEWLDEELEFEATIYQLTGNEFTDLAHKRFARTALDVRPTNEVNNQILDQYNERISRYESNPHIYQ